MTFALRCAVALLVGLPSALRAQMTIGGYVRNAAGAPIQDATVTIPALSANTRTNADGSYNLLIRAALIRGQAVPMTARHGRFGTETVQVRIVGGSLRQDFVLSAAARPERIEPRADSGFRALTRDPTRGDATLLADESISETAGATDLESALAGRFAALRVVPSATPGGSPFAVYRGVRSLAGAIQPLVVVDGVPVDNNGFNAIAQRAGLGGFDYGTPAGDLSLTDIARVELLEPLIASLRYGSRAANGVIEVHTRNGRGLTGFAVSVAQRIGGDVPTVLPEFQDDYGQGLGGAFEFFDGLGGGVNDAVAESWGPRLDARPIAQHSLVEPRRPDVRYWLPQPDDMRDYFGGARTVETNVAVQGSRETSHLRAAINARRATGLTPEHVANRLGVTIGGGARPSPRVSITANLQYIGSTAERRPGTGFDEVNPVAGFTRMGRQVDLDALRATVTDANGSQINWIYTSRNNPFAATDLNSNEDDRRHIIGGASVSYEITSRLSTTLTAGTDDWTETRTVSVPAGWLGGFPTTIGRGDLSGGGSDDHDVRAAERLLRLSIESRPVVAMGFALSGSAGGELRRNEFRSTSVVTDQPASGAASVTSVERSATHDVTSAFLAVAGSRGVVSLGGGARMESSSSLPKSYSVLYPGAQVTVDATNLIGGTFGLGDSRVFARVWQAGNELTRRTLASAFLPGTPVGPELDSIRPERTSAVEAGVAVSSRGGGFAFDVTGYRERSTDVLALVPNADGSVFVSQTAEIFNGGVEGRVRARLLGADTASGGAGSWEVSASAARNASTVDRLAPTAGNEGEFEVPLSPELLGAMVAARVGSSAGVITGSRLLRNASGALVLRDGLPIADAATPFATLGSIQPDWTATLRSDLRFRGFELGLAIDARLGGEIFSATNMWGSRAGTLASTLVGDRAPGAAPSDSLLVAGIDSASGAANTIRVSAEQYFHALGEITEPWVYDASYTKLREVRLSYRVPARFLPGFRQHSLRVSLVGANLVTWASAPNIDPETTLSNGVIQGIDMGQLPGRRSVGLHVELRP